LTTAFYTVVFSGLLIVPTGWTVNQVVTFGPEFTHLRWDWPALSSGEALRLGTLGVVGLAGYALLSRAYQITSASLVAPFDYSYLPMATLMAYFVWGEVPGRNTLIGMGLIVVSGLYLGYRELKSSRGRIEPLPVAEAVIAPGNPTAPMSLGPEHQDQERPGG
jgi:drug/metabolite transporter (DMT)-like permease